MSTNKNIYVVGNIFKALSNGENMFTYDEIIKKIEQKEIELAHANIHLGQGISEVQFEFLTSIIGDIFCNISNYYNDKKRCADTLTHKYKSYNSLISDPEQEGEDIYSSMLMIDERCAELSDHVTGKHIQFMLLIESSRQMVNAVTEKFYSDNSKIYLANKISVDFINFVYPFSTKLIYSVKEKQIKSSGDGKMIINICFEQFEKKVCQFQMEFTIMNRGFITGLENSALRKIA